MMTRPNITIENGHENDTKITLTVEQARALGESVVMILNPPRDKDHPDRYQTTFGTKTFMGIGHTVARLLNEVMGPKRPSFD